MAFIVTPGQLTRRSELYYQLGSMIGAGVPLLQALEMTQANPTIRASRKTIAGLIESLEAGMTFSESMTHVQGWMPEFDIALLAAGEQSGRLDESFKLLSSYYATRATIIRDTIAGLLVTIATLHVFLMVFPIGLLTEFVQGIMANDPARYFPFIIEKFVAFGSLYGIVFLTIFASQANRGEAWRSIMESLFGLVPVLGTARKYLVLARLSAALESLNSAGTSIVQGWELASAASGSPHLRRTVSGWRNEIRTGATPGELVNRTSYFPEMFANLYSTGEHSGQLDQTLHRLQAYFQEEGFRKLRVFTRIMNGTLYGGMALLVAIYVIRFYLNYYGAIMRNI
jgi:type IV pilus assembly protein PilC